MKCLTLNGESTSRELASLLGKTIYTTSRASSLLAAHGLIYHPVTRKRYWAVDRSKKLVRLMEKYLLITKGNEELFSLIKRDSVLRVIGVLQKQSSLTTEEIVRRSGLSRPTLRKVLGRLLNSKYCIKFRERPHQYCSSRTEGAKVFYQLCGELTTLLHPAPVKSTLNKTIRELRQRDDVLILVHYGSTARGSGDEYSDFDLFVVVGDRYLRGEILSKYKKPGIDLAVYTINGFSKMCSKEPDFIANLATAKILKGKEYLVTGK
ncbi:MAG: nucleotidyltransferase domain-containing protein [Candidatus Wallbacteria bacterium]|nr:nucleotidyltransferase domain-containing protein [Candidatus Wallbacteria bacterium]